MIQQTIDLLGRKATDKVTGFSGVVSSVCFDLYGCVQVALTPPIDRDGKPDEGHWYDVQRLEVSAEAPVMNRPDFAARAPEPAQYDHGAAEKPARSIR